MTPLLTSNHQSQIYSFPYPIYTQLLSLATHIWTLVSFPLSPYSFKCFWGYWKKPSKYLAWPPVFTHSRLLQMTVRVVFSLNTVLIMSWKNSILECLSIVNQIKCIIYILAFWALHNLTCMNILKFISYILVALFSLD